MDKALIAQLQIISSEEQEYASGARHVKKDLYSHKDLSEVDCSLLLKKGRLITVRPHSRFIEFPPHRHNYIEIMYVCQGSITHYIDGKELTMHGGDLLLLNQHVKHGIKEAGYDDIGINFIALPEFFDIPLRMLKENNVIADFLAGIFRQNHPVSHYLLFELKNEKNIENLMENMIRTILSDEQEAHTINQYSMGLVFLYLINHMNRLTQNSSQNYHDVILHTTAQYLNSHYKTATLGELAGQLHHSLPSLSKLIRQSTGFTFQDLLIQKRMQNASLLLLDTDLSIEEIASNIGYENYSYFYRLFKKFYGMTPNQFRRTQTSDSFSRSEAARHTVP